MLVGGVRDAAHCSNTHQAASKETHDVDDTISSIMSYSFHCPSCLAAIQTRRNLRNHFESNPGCPFRDPDECVVEDSVDGSSPLEESPASPIATNTSGGEDDDEEPNHQDPPSPFFPGGGDDVFQL